MASKTPLLAVSKPKGNQRSKGSVFYNADEYMEDLKAKFAHDHEIADIMGAAPDKGGGIKDKKVLNEAGRSKMTGRLPPESNRPDPMPKDLSFMFTKISPEQVMYMWSFLTGIFVLQCAMIMGYAFMLHRLGNEYWWSVSILFGAPFAYVAIQHIYIDHDVMHGATFAPFWWQKYLTHPFSDFISICWEDFIMEHMQHHGSTVDLLTQGEFGWDPEKPLYWLAENDKYYLTMWLIPIAHFFGLNDTGAMFCLEWFSHFPHGEEGGKCSKDFWSKWFPRRLKHLSFVWFCWACVYVLGWCATGQGLKFMLCVSFFARCGYGAAWTLITSFTHSHPWNQFLENDPDRTWPKLHAAMAFLLGGRHRWNEMLFHDVHHAFPNAVGTLSQRGRFNGWEAVHDGAVTILARGLFKPNGDEETIMQKQQKRRSLLLQKKKEESNGK